ncbi:hypothetical protein [Allobranchiibius sp. GilTou73]|uniref:hypothetical protein n=1 Tax=Allobranchiibius sp. GilTou73 TaxID=2904523 RepID=UPI001F43259F|nr:hypothetical protein [Allobranchiibius sp. GilTou73]UIJ33341.1 hypothetical protein LVQ62_09030 [Allobranchiibius sp. GilTou73]
MAAVLIRLKLTILRRSLGRDTSRLVSYLIGAIVAAILVMGSLPLAVGLRAGSVTDASGAVAAMSTVTLLWMLAPLLMAGVDRTLDAGAFSVLPLGARRLIPGLTLAALVGIPGAVTAALALEQVLVWSRSVPATLAAIVAAFLGAATCVVLSRMVTSVIARSLWRRRARFLVTMVLPLIYLAPLVLDQFLERRRSSHGSAAAHHAATVAEWTPFGWAWAVPWEVARGAYADALLHLALATALLLTLVVLWERVLDVELTTTAPRQAGTVRVSRAPSRRSRPLTAIARRRLLGWRRDPRLTMQAVSLIAVSVLPVLPALISSGGSHPSGLLPLALSSVMAGVLIANDLAYDGTAWWMQVVAGVPGWVDRAGRALAIGVSILVFDALVSVLQIAVGAHTAWLAVSGPLVGGLLISLGLGAAMGALDPGQATRRGANPFAGNAGGGARGCLTAAVMFVVPAVLVAPVIVGAVLARHSAIAECVVLAAALIWGSGGLGIGIWWGGRRLDRGAPEMLGKLRKFA